MTDTKPKLSDEQFRQRALARWENEGGAIPSDAQVDHAHVEGGSEVPQLTNAELV